MTSLRPTTGTLFSDWHATMHALQPVQVDEVDRHAPAVAGVVLLLEQRVAAGAGTVGVARVRWIGEEALGLLGAPHAILVELLRGGLLDQLGEPLGDAFRVDVAVAAGDRRDAQDAGADVPVLLDARRARTCCRSPVTVALPAMSKPAVGADLVGVPADAMLVAAGRRRDPPRCDHRRARGRSSTAPDPASCSRAARCCDLPPSP